jgi:hypothetical protein
MTFLLETFLKSFKVQQFSVFNIQQTWSDKYDNLIYIYLDGELEKTINPPVPPQNTKNFIISTSIEYISSW